MGQQLDFLDILDASLESAAPAPESVGSHASPRTLEAHRAPVPALGQWTTAQLESAERWLRTSLRGKTRSPILEHPSPALKTLAAAVLDYQALRQHAMEGAMQDGTPKVLGAWVRSPLGPLLATLNAAFIDASQIPARLAELAETPDLPDPAC